MKKFFFHICDQRKKKHDQFPNTYFNIKESERFFEIVINMHLKKTDKFCEYF